jgi:hypothetical protein
MFFSNIWTFLRIIRLHFNYSCFKTLNYLRLGPHFKQSYTDGIGRRDEYETLRKNSRQPMFFPVRAHVFPSMVPGKSSNLFWTHNIVPMKVSNLICFYSSYVRHAPNIIRYNWSFHVHVFMSVSACPCFHNQIHWRLRPYVDLLPLVLISWNVWSLKSYYSYVLPRIVFYLKWDFITQLHYCN